MAFQSLACRLQCFFGLHRRRFVEVNYVQVFKSGDDQLPCMTKTHVFYRCDRCGKSLLKTWPVPVPEIVLKGGE
jgi:hypothetical protein